MKKLFGALAMAALIQGCSSVPQKIEYISNGIPVLMYHRIETLSTKPDDMIVNQLSFAEQMRFIRDNNYKVISLSELVSIMANGSVVPEKTLVITFDDGWKSQLRAVAFLDLYKFPATFFVLGDAAHDKQYLSWADIKLLREKKYDVQSHSMTHNIDSANIDREILQSKKVIEEKISHPVLYFSWPNGKYSDEYIKFAKQSGYVGAVSIEEGGNLPGGDSFKIKRIFVDGRCPIETFERILTERKSFTCH